MCFPLEIIENKIERKNFEIYFHTEFCFELGESGFITRCLPAQYSIASLSADQHTENIGVAILIKIENK